MQPVKIAIIGFGGIARAHYVGYTTLLEKNTPISIVAAVDINPAQFERELRTNIEGKTIKLDPSVHRYTSVDDLLANEDFDMADICLPSYLHCSYSVKMLNAGKHVLCEKPMALSTEECQKMIDASRKNGRQLMVAQCLRLANNYRYLKKVMEDGTLGKLKQLYMERMCALPSWGFENWFQNADKSGGCILDTHIHDVDITRYYLGDPQAVSTVAYDEDMRWQVQHTRLHYPDLTVVINGSWGETRGTPFRSGFRAVFEHGTLLSQPGDRVQVWREGEEPYIADVGAVDMYEAEIAYFIETIRNNLTNEHNPPESAARSVLLIEALRRSAALGGEKIAYVPIEF